MSTITLSGLFVYPVKGARGITLDRAQATSLGIEHDRRFMIVDPDGEFLTQREHPEMALIETTIEGEALILGAKGHGPLRLPLRPEGPTNRRVRVWSDKCSAVFVGDEAAAYLSDYLGRRVELVYMPADAARRVDGRYARRKERVAFADGFPFLLTSEGSLADLNARLAEGVPMDRFRPNLVVRGAPPWGEDAWTSLSIGSVVFHSRKACSRCSVITVDQATGARGQDPLATLATFRARANRVYFGWNLVAEEEGELRVGDAVTLLARSYDEAR
ncbi:MOSC domain-containing protein [Polyangium spumosum]|uniref:MOSC domain-containing protein n=1 Tax=Polyangium spumosum TaxID=889282 RepID=A0A6N7PPE7_9BACT|nr:MOSC N-terminal beta barrel domain-containing protein [Polyangium spumosum]MRG93497.1 MOSC domain-containing protein [Polyangium spumosum]